MLTLFCGFCIGGIVDFSLAMKIGRLALLNGNDAGKVFLLKDLSVFEGGRSPGNHVLLKAPSVAMSHFRICRKEEEFSIYDQGSKHGTLVNGKPVERVVLQPGDVIKAGELEIQFDLVDETTQGKAASSAPDLDSLVTPVPGSLEAQSELEEENDVAVKTATVPALLVVEGEERGRVYPLVGKIKFQVGRLNTADIRLHDGKVSRLHCSVEIVRDHFVVVDLESSNGTVVNGERVKKTVLKDGDHIRHGFTILKYTNVQFDH